MYTIWCRKLFPIINVQVFSYMITFGMVGRIELCVCILYRRMASRLSERKNILAFTGSD